MNSDPKVENEIRYSHYKITAAKTSYIFLLAIFIGAITALFPYKSLVIILGSFLLLSTFIFPNEVFLIFVFLLLSFGDYFGATSIVIGGFNFYGADYFIVLLVIIFMKNKISKFKSPLSVLLILYIIYGFFCLINGLFYQSHEFNRTIGEFRRFFFYPLSFFLGLNVIQEKKDIIKLEKVVSLIPPIIMFFAIIRITTRLSWAFYIHKTAEDFRAMAYYDGVTLLFVFSYFISVLFIRKKLNLYQIIITVLIPLFLIFSGFRLLWGLFFLSVTLIFWIFIKKVKNRKKMFRTSLYIIIITAISILSFRHIAPRYYETMKEKFISKILRYEMQEEIWRHAAWSFGINKFYSSPIYGTGLGEEPTFWTISSTGKWYRTTHPTHNIIIDLLYQTGTIGALFFLIFISIYGLHVYKNLQKVDNDLQPILIALFIYFVCGLIQSLFQPYLHHPGNAVFFFCSVGIAMKMIKISNELIIGNKKNDNKERFEKLL